MKRTRIASHRAPLEIHFSDRPPFNTAHERQEVVNLIKLLLEPLLIGIDNPKSNTVIMDTLTGGRSGAYVFKLTPLLGPDGQCMGVPAVIKISPLEKGVCEKANYDRFVRPFLPAACRPELLGFATALDRAALYYSFVGDGDSARPATLTDYLRAGDVAMLDYMLSNIFDSLHQSWYSPYLISEESDIAQLYLARYFEDMSIAAEAEETLAGCVARYFSARRNDSVYRVGEMTFPSTCGALFGGVSKRPYHSCIQHGDLNTDNIIITRDRSCVRLIDFQRTGRGHVYQDLVSLEASVRINYPPDAPYREILETERLIARGERRFPANSYAAAVVKVRDAAYHYFGRVEKSDAYQFAIAAVGLRLMQATDLSDAACARISASTLWAAKALTA